jgi:anti-sigma regulatory factor (Ser/Thr protein kinase)
VRHDCQVEIVPFEGQVALSIREQSEIAQARHHAIKLAEELEFDEELAGKAAIIASECATNLVKHGDGGEVLLRRMDAGLEVLAIDKGHGMANVSQCLGDGYSSSGTAGNGLGAIKRLSNFFDIYTQPAVGTVILSRMFRDGREDNRTETELGVVCRPKQGEEVAGDAWAIKLGANEDWILVVDGLGHGQIASEAAIEAVRVFRQTDGQRSTVDMLETLHGALRKTRGAAVTVTVIDRAMGQARSSGVGNITTTVVTNGISRSLVSHNGILGHEVRRIQEFSSPWTPNSRLLMHSDGLATWNLERYPGLLARHPAVMAGVLYRDLWRERDDVTVLVVQDAVER